MKFKLFLVSVSLFFPLQAFAVCSINGTERAEGEVSPFNDCELCDSSRAANTWSPKICLNSNFDPQCQVSVCDPGLGCVPRQLPEHTRCMDPVCENGEIRQTECSALGKCDQNRVKSCKGFSCLDAQSCSSECVDDSDCRNPATCIRQVCKLPEVGADMGGDTGSRDMGVAHDMGVDQSDGTHSSNDGGADGGSKPQTDVGVSKPVPVSNEGCSTAPDKGFSFFFLLFGLFAFSRRRR